MNTRFIRGLLFGGLAGAAIGAYWMLRTDRSVEKMLLKRDRQVRKQAHRTARSIKHGARQIGSTVQSGTDAVKAGWHAWRD
ncbi:MAG: hypothetical protein GX316_05030 [Firmicutes bacterium]|nr:hypothetical protein [Bacillota bacterium]